MGMMKRFNGWLKGTDQDVEAPELREAELAVAATQPPREAVVVAVPVPAPAPPLAVSVPSGEAKRETAPKAAGVKKVMLEEEGLSVLDLRELPCSRFRIVGSAYWVTDSGRYKHGGNEYLLVREPKNKWDANAVAVYGKGRKVGYLTEAKAAALAPTFDALNFDAYRVGGAAPEGNSTRMWVDIPALPRLRTFAKTLLRGAANVSRTASM
jgi:hypothetical protein